MYKLTIAMARGSRDGLILVSSVPEGPQVVPRIKGELTHKDKDRLTSEGIPSECWEDETKLMKARYLKDGDYQSVIIEDTTYMKKQHALDRIAALFNNTTAQGGIKPGACLYATGFGKTGLIAGLVKIDFFPEKASTKFKYCLRKI